MSKSLTKSGFTLVELLLAAAIFAAVAVVSTGTLAATVRLNLLQKQSQITSAQSQSVADSIVKEIEGSSLTQIVQLNTTSTLAHGNAYPHDDMIYLETLPRAEDGSLTGSTQYRVYCAAITTDGSGKINGKRLVRFTLAGAAIMNYNANPSECTQTSIASVTTQTVGVPEYLADPVHSVLSFRAWPVWATTCVLCDLNPQGVRLEINARYDKNNGGVNEEVRFNDSAQLRSPQVVIQRLAQRNHSYTYKP